MTVSLQDVRALLDVDEPDYVFASLLGPAALPHLHELVTTGEPMLASKAAYLAGLIEGGGEVVATAAASEEPLVRIAAAGTAVNLSAQEAEPILASLVDDGELGVRVTAAKAVLAETSAVSAESAPALVARANEVGVERELEPVEVPSLEVAYPHGGPLGGALGGAGDGEPGGDGAESSTGPGGMPEAADGVEDVSSASKLSTQDEEGGESE